MALVDSIPSVVSTADVRKLRVALDDVSHMQHLLRTGMGQK
jgi:hypothetical protein